MNEVIRGDRRPASLEGQVVADTFDHDAGAPTPNVRVFGYDFREDPLDPYLASDPGFNALPRSGLPAGSQLIFNIPDASRFALPGNLSYWNGSGDVSFASVPSGETLRFSLGAQSRTVGGNTGDISGFASARWRRTDRFTATSIASFKGPTATPTPRTGPSPRTASTCCP